MNTWVPFVLKPFGAIQSPEKSLFISYLLSSLSFYSFFLFFDKAWMFSHVSCHPFATLSLGQEREGKTPPRLAGKPENPRLKAT